MNVGLGTTRRGAKAVSRRQFIAGAAAAATVAVMKPSRVRGMEANSRVEVGCVGLGGRGRLIAGMIAKVVVLHGLTESVRSVAIAHALMQGDGTQQ